MRFLSQLRTPLLKRVTLINASYLRNYGSAAGLSKPIIQSRVLDLLTEFDKVNASKVISFPFLLFSFKLIVFTLKINSLIQNLILQKT